MKYTSNTGSYGGSYWVAVAVILVVLIAAGVLVWRRCRRGEH